MMESRGLKRKLKWGGKWGSVEGNRVEGDKVRVRLI